MNLNSNDEVIEFLFASGYPTEYNDGLLAWLRDLYQSELTLPDLLHRYRSTYGNEIMSNVVIEKSGEQLAFVNPATTFVSTVATSASGGSRTTLTSAGTHGLLTADVVTPGNVNIFISAGTGWTPGFYRITAIDLDTTGVAITIDTPFTSQGTPTIALGTTEVTVKTITLPPLALNSMVEVDWSTSNPSLGSFAPRCRFDGTVLTGTTVTSLSARSSTIFQNRNSLTSQIGGLGANVLAGYGNTAVALPTTTVDTSSSTSVLTLNIQPPAAKPVMLERYVVILKL